MTSAAVRLRVSTGHQEADNQVPDVERFIAHHGYQVTARYEVSESAWEGGQDGGQYRRTLTAALDDAHAGKFEVIVVWALDRINREGAEGVLGLIRQFKQRGCTLVSVRESWLNVVPEVQDVLVAFAGWMAGQESRRRRQEAAQVRGYVASWEAANAAPPTTPGRRHGRHDRHDRRAIRPERRPAGMARRPGSRRGRRAIGPLAVARATWSE